MDDDVGEPSEGEIASLKQIAGLVERLSGKDGRQ